MYTDFETDLKSVEAWMDKADQVLNEADSMPLDQQVAAPQIEKYKVGVHYAFGGLWGALCETERAIFKSLVYRYGT